MNKPLAIILLLAGAMWGCLLMAQAGGEPSEPSAEETSSPTVTAALDINSAFVWRGITLNDGVVLQPWIELSGISIGRVPLTLTIWSNFDHGDFGGALRKNRFSEVDITISAGLGAGFEAGFTQYCFANQLPVEDEEIVSGTGEFSLSWSGQWKAITPKVTLYYDVEEADAAFFTFALSRSFPLSDKVSLDLAGEVGAASDAFAEYYTGTKGGLYHYNTVAKVTYQPSEHFGLAVSAGYTNHFKESVLPSQEVDFYAGLSLAYSF